ncbi:uncharacterized protein MYCFIDRAFT_180736 [Pseudocercospora fijiensis CIRAD86]|uniref:Uncharacterized protein n=1 Tax=Pseudocercospora fijiensis (strain CIRAD86) TaxID=383855 RepID=M3AHT2_PSEFD|nr:uncharacterized protein MYCFIDRAFT_180736 [Pseudocercospora fijiensis CIRAD86]EME76748.1 hypothetical protein MYCFIDRAFT_180736 [Pseudocercospora fijiensis CIRAD86]
MLLIHFDLSEPHPRIASLSFEANEPDCMRRAYLICISAGFWSSLLVVIVCRNMAMRASSVMPQRASDRWSEDRLTVMANGMTRLRALAMGEKMILCLPGASWKLWLAKNCSECSTDQHCFNKPFNLLLVTSSSSVTENLEPHERRRQESVTGLYRSGCQAHECGDGEEAGLPKGHSALGISLGKMTSCLFLTHEPCSGNRLVTCPLNDSWTPRDMNQRMTISCDFLPKPSSIAFFGWVTAPRHWLYYHSGLEQWFPQRHQNSSRRFHYMAVSRNAILSCLNESPLSGPSSVAESSSCNAAASLAYGSLLHSWPSYRRLPRFWLRCLHLSTVTSPESPRPTPWVVEVPITRKDAATQRQYPIPSVLLLPLPSSRFVQQPELSGLAVPSLVHHVLHALHLWAERRSKYAYYAQPYLMHTSRYCLILWTSAEKPVLKERSLAWYRDCHQVSAAIPRVVVQSSSLIHAAFIHAYFTYTDFLHGDFIYAYFIYADFITTDLIHPYVIYADSTYADFTHADSTHADFTYVDFTHADFTHADFTHADFIDD